MRKTSSSKIILLIHSFERPVECDDDDEDNEEDEEGYDILDKNLETFKLFGLSILVLLTGFTIGYATSEYEPISINLPDDPMFLIFRVFITLLLVFLIYFVSVWRTLVQK